MRRLHDNTLKITGRLKIRVFDPVTGETKQELETENLVVDAGLDHIADQFGSQSQAVMSHMAIGQGAVAPAANDTTLGSELGRVALSSRTTAANTTSFSATFPAGTGTGSVTEAGIFNAASAGTMLNRSTFGVVTKGANDAMTINWDVTIN